MKLLKPAAAGTLESSDCFVSIEPSENGIEIDLKSDVIRQFGDRIREVIGETLETLGIENCTISVTDKGALDCTIRARVESAAFRSAEIKEEIPWEKL
ncbi:MAG: citrate lyase acyl carrier protein [Clostridia bacterium]|nr:citrate lyase acyl carrier protein [Clostridia bacterium]MBQ5956760.1 citrate lyase acyl carrier protein [Clostridia bacterium]